MLLYARSGYNINSKKSKETAWHTKYPYEKTEDTVQVSSKRHDMSRTGTENSDIKNDSPNDRNKYDQEAQRTEKNAN